MEAGQSCLLDFCQETIGEVDMPWKLLLTLFIIALLIMLVGFNWSNASDVSLFGLYTFPNVPIIVTIGISFLVGSLISIPFAIQSTSRRLKKQGTSKPEPKQKHVSQKKKKNKRLPKSKKQPLPEASSEEQPS